MDIPKPGVAQLAAELRVDERELASAVLRIFPDGKLTVEEADARLPRVPGSIGATFGTAVRQARKARGWTQARLAENLSGTLGRTVPMLVITRTERAQRPVPFDEVAALAVLLDLSIDDLIRAQVRMPGEGR